MRKFIAVSLALLMLAMATPASQAETFTRNYTLAAGGDGIGALIICLGPPEQEICEDNGIDPIGGYDGRRTGSGSATTLIVDIQDDVFDQTYTVVCVYTDDHSICDEEVGDVTTEGCGGATLTGHSGITTANPVAGFVYNYHVTDDLDVCLGSSGTGDGKGAVLTYV